MLGRALKEFLSLLGAALIALLIQTTLLQPFFVPSGSMYPTLEVGDFFVASKFSYGYSPYSLPWYHPRIFSGRIFPKEPTRGQVVAFNAPAIDGNPDSTDDYIKRCVGLPGDRIQMRKGILHINGEPVKLERIEDYVLVDPRPNKDIKVIPQYLETLPNGLQHKILKSLPFGEGSWDNTKEFIVPEGHYFMMGDNRDDSQDSRAMNPVGFVPFERLIAPAQLIWFSTEAKWRDVFHWISGLRLNRFFTWIK